MVDQCAGQLGECLAELDDPRRPTCAGEAGRHRRGAGDQLVRGPGRGTGPVPRVVHAGADRQAAGLLQQHHADRADAAGRQPVSLRGGSRGEGRAAQGSALRLRPGRGSRRHRQRHLTARGHRARRLRRHRRRRRPPHRRAGNQPPDPPESPRPRHHPGPWGKPIHDLLRRPDRDPRRRGGRLRPGRDGGPAPLATGPAGTGATVPARRGARQTGR